ncbi:hypothetical protein RCC94_11035 [Exiguobacterium acetylicum]|uniref:nSTAND3 domain-containing NTPase n=1 Tax=Exiguobacterium acetylicum TaxID=41170 RepID=UPI0027E1D332|nr:hypothetical protein [Exiguobacterium acetylicum]MDQ6468022.1 hypothetical protein [Exiguobacterium acetylicum]
MSRLNDIQNKILQMEGGKFQKLCDSYLYRKRNLENITSLGSMEGTDKTTKGIPDTYYWDSKYQGYVLVMYGTKKNATAKLEKDIREAIEKTKINRKDIKEIICCHTSSNLTVEKDKMLRDLASPIELTLIGIDTLSHDLLDFKYQGIVKDFLRVQESTEQVWSLEQFISIHDKSKTNAPLNTQYIETEPIIKELIKDLNDNQIFLLYGVPGAGKTKIAIETCKKLSDDYNVICVKSNLIDVYQDIKNALDKERLNYLFLDDANTITDLKAITSLLKLVEYEKNLKILMTVREYAVSQIANQISSFKTKHYKISLMENEKIEILIKSINNLPSSSVRKIMKLSHNNPRLAVIATNLTKDKNFMYLNDENDVLESYYGQIVEDNVLSTEEKITLFILSFKKKLNLINISDFEDLLAFFELNSKIFTESLNQLNNKELCDIFKNKAAKVRDQSLSDFIIIDFLVNKNIIKIRELFIKLYPIYQEEILDILNVINNFKFNQDWSDYLTSEIKFVYTNLIKEDNKAKFLQQYGRIIPIESLSYVQKKINNTEKIQFNMSQKEFEQQQKNFTHEDEIVSVLRSMAQSKKSNHAAILLINYFQKRPDKILQVFSAIHYDFNIDDTLTNYLEKRSSIIKIFNSLPKITEITALLIVNIAEDFLKFSTEKITFYEREGFISRYKLVDGDYLIKHHQDVFTLLSKIYYLNYKDPNDRIDKLIMKYPVYESENGFLNTVKSDLICIENLFFKNFEQLTIRQEALFFNLVTQAKRLNLNISSFDDFIPSNKQLIYYSFSSNAFDSNFDYERSIETRKKNLKFIYRKHSEDLLCLFNTLRNYQLDELLNTSRIEESICILYSCLKVKEKEHMLSCLLNSDYVLFHNYNGFNFFMNDLSFESSKKILNSIEKEIDSSWYLSNFLTSQKIDQLQAKEFMIFLKQFKDYKKFSFFNVLSFEKYIEKNDDFLPFLLSQYEKNLISESFFIPAYVSKENAEKIINLLGYTKSKILYLKGLELDNIDESGKFLDALLKDQDFNFICSYFIKLNSLKFSRNLFNKFSIHLKYIWNSTVVEKGIRGYLDYLIKENLGKSIGINSYLEKLYKANPEKFFQFIEKEIFITKDKERLSILYNLSLEIINCDKKLIDLFKLLKNKEIDELFFRTLHLIPISRYWSNSLVPNLDKEIKFLNSLLNLFEDINYLSYSMIITEKIDKLNEQRESELLSDYLE